MTDTAVFIDGGYLSQILRNSFGTAKIDYQLLAHWAADERLMRAYYYDCLPWQSPQPTQDEQKRFGGMQKFFMALNSLQRMTVREGRLERRLNNGVPYYVQKRVDLQIGLDIASIIARGRVSRVALLAGDSDLLPAVEYAKQEGMIVKLVHGPANTYHNDLWLSADERDELDQNIINKLQM
jgi:uncharacterized LabA/DUF88 family protein